MLVSSSMSSPKANIMNAAQTAASCKQNVPTKCKEQGRCILDAKGMSFAETKSANLIAYEGKEGDIYTFPDGKEWKVEECKEYPSTGYRDVVLKPLDPNDDRVILGFAGTGDWEDVKTDAAQVSGYIPEQYKQADARAKEIKERYPDAQFKLTGHSLGGGLATYASAMNGCIPSTGINSAPLGGDIHERRLKTPSYPFGTGEDIVIPPHGTIFEVSKTPCRNTTHYNTSYDPVHNTLGGRLGEQWGNEHIEVYGDGGLGTILKGGRHKLLNTAPCVEPPTTAPQREAIAQKQKEEENWKQLADKAIKSRNNMVREYNQAQDQPKQEISKSPEKVEMPTPEKNLDLYNKMVKDYNQAQDQSTHEISRNSEKSVESKMPMPMPVPTPKE